MYSLPRTSYLKLIDIWLVFAMGIPFAEVALHTIMDNLKKDIRLEKKQDGIGNHVIKVHTKNGQVMDVDEGQEK